jgi:hypothetical protein
VAAPVQRNRRRSTAQARVEHVFAQQEAMGLMGVRTLGVVRVRFKIGTMAWRTTCCGWRG